VDELIERHREIGGVGVAVVRLGLQALEDDRLKARREAVHDRARPRRRRREAGLNLGDARGGAEGRPARAEPVHRHAELVDVHAPVERGLLELLGRHVAQLALEDVDLGDRLALLPLRDAEVDELGVTVLAHQDVGEAHVAVDDAQGLALGVLERVRVVQRLRDPLEDEREVAEVAPVAVPELAVQQHQVRAVDVLHDQEGQVLVLAELEHRRDVRVLKPRAEAGFIQEHPIVVRAVAMVRVAPHPRRHRREPVRRPRRGDQHHAAHPAVQGAEVIHLGHNRSVDDVVEAAGPGGRAGGGGQSSYQGGHMEYFRYLVERLARSAGRGRSGLRRRRRRDRARGDRRAAGRGRGRPHLLPEDGRRHGLPGHHRRHPAPLRLRPDSTASPPDAEALARRDVPALARTITASRPRSTARTRRAACVRPARPPRTVPVLGITGTGGAGKSSLTDELLRRSASTTPTRSASRCSPSTPPAPRRRRAARRPHPHERHRPARGVLHAVAGHPRPGSELPGRHLDAMVRLPRPPAPTWSSSRPPASARATPRSPTSPTWRST
jgi:hypothetical protein